MRNPCSSAPARRCRPAVCAVAGLAGLVLAGCSDAAADATPITATDTACTVASTSLRAGKHSFAVTNDGKKVTEVYVYAKGDRVVAERENIGPGTKATFTVNLAAGAYEVACKPGQTGAGIREDLTVSGPGGAAAAPPADREVSFGAKDYAFTGLDAVTIATGETIAFEMTNNGTVEHEFEVFGLDDKAMGEIGPTAVRQTGKVTLTFDKPGTYKVACGIADHKARGMVGTLTVT